MRTLRTLQAILPAGEWRAYRVDPTWIRADGSLSTVCQRFSYDVPASDVVGAPSEQSRCGEDWRDCPILIAFGVLAVLASVAAVISWEMRG